MYETSNVANPAAAPFALPDLPYDAEGLAPVISRQTVELHHGKHHRAYVDKLNELLAERPDLAASGRHVFLYHHPTQRDQPMEIDFGIEVANPFDAAGAVKCVSTPEGRVAVATHVGTLRSLPQTHMAIHHWCNDYGHAIGGLSWETYTWGGGPDPVEIVVRYQLR